MAQDLDARRTELRDAAHKLIAADYFTMLGVARAATPDDVKKAFMESVKTWHPDRIPPGQDELKPLYSKVFARLELARVTLSDSARRTRYIEELTKPSVAASSADISMAEATLEFKKGEALLKKNDLAGAEQHLRRSVQLAPTNLEAQVLLVWLQAKPDANQGRLDELEKNLSKLLKDGAPPEKTLFYRGQLRKRLNRLADANADFARVAELDPKHVDATRELRIFKMREEKKSPEKASSEDGFFKKLFRR